MKKWGFAVVLSLGMAFNAQAQNSSEVKFPVLDKSPLDVAYFPVNTTKVKEAIRPVMRVLYSRPQKKGREVFGVLEPYGKVWRMGANESTELEVFKEISIGGKQIKPGRYSLFAIPEADKWTFIVNKQVDRWGAFSYNQALDLVRTDVPVGKTAAPQEAFAISFIETATGANLILAWDNTQIEIPITFKK